MFKQESSASHGFSAVAGQQSSSSCNSEMTSRRTAASDGALSSVAHLDSPSALVRVAPLLCTRLRLNSSKKNAHRASLPERLDAERSAQRARESVTRSKRSYPTYCLNFVRAKTAARSSPSADARVFSRPRQMRLAKAIGTSSCFPLTSCS